MPRKGTEPLQNNDETHWLDTTKPGYVTLCQTQGNDSNIVNEYTTATCPECRRIDRES